METTKKKTAPLDGRMTIRMASADIRGLMVLAKAEDDLPTLQEMVRRLISRAVAREIEDMQED